MESIHLTQSETEAYESGGPEGTIARRAWRNKVAKMGPGARVEIYAADGYVLECYRVDADGEVGR